MSIAGHLCISGRLGHALIIHQTYGLPRTSVLHLALLCLMSDQIDCHAGKKLDQKVEQGIMASGVLLLTLAAVVLVVRDTINLGSGKSFM